MPPAGDVSVRSARLWRQSRLLVSVSTLTSDRSQLLVSELSLMTGASEINTPDGQSYRSKDLLSFTARFIECHGGINPLVL